MTNLLSGVKAGQVKTSTLHIFDIEKNKPNYNSGSQCPDLLSIQKIEWTLTGKPCEN